MGFVVTKGTEQNVTDYAIPSQLRQKRGVAALCHTVKIRVTNFFITEGTEQIRIKNVELRIMNEEL